MSAYLVTAFGVLLGAAISLIAWFGMLILSRLTDITGRLAKQEFILTGAQEENGVRGDVKELMDVTRKLSYTVEEIRHRQNNDADRAQTRLGEWTEWRREVEDQLKSKPRPRRKKSKAA
jgi:hypothetical protein